MEHFIIQIFALSLLVTASSAIRPSHSGYTYNYQSRPPPFPAPPPPQHPLDPLNGPEILETVRIIKEFRPDVDWVFHSISLKEPQKSLVLDYFLKDKPVPSNSVLPRKSTSSVRDPTSPDPSTVIINLSTGRVESWVDEGTGKFARATFEEADVVFQALLDNPEVVERCRRGGYPNMSLIQGSLSSISYVDDRPDWIGKRIVKSYVFGKNFINDNANAHPFDFWPVIDLVAKKVIAIEELPTHSNIDDDGQNKVGVVIPKTEHNYAAELLGEDFFRKDLKPVLPKQDGTSFKIYGNEVHWMGFRFRVGFNGREGLVLHWISYNDNSTVRPLFYRLSLAEKWVPYGDPREGIFRRDPFDEGEYGLGYLANSLKQNEDCMGNAAFFDATLHDSIGDLVHMPDVICIREEDSGLGWKHTNPLNQHFITRRQRLVITFTSNVGPYDYEFGWYFYQDATIEFNTKMTGILNVNLFAQGNSPGGFGTTLADQINGIYHQHFFALRIDPEIDGNKNTVVQQDVHSAGPTGSRENKWGSGIKVNTTVFNTAAEARSHEDPSSRRTWLMTDAWPIDGTKQSSGWKLKPHASPRVFINPDSVVMEKAHFTDYNVWVTPYHDDQFYPAGDYVNKSGLPEWVARNPNANIANTDVCLFYVFNEVHITRVEDYPIMPSQEISVKLEPFNFFKQNPSLNIPQVQKENPFRPHEYAN